MKRRIFETPLLLVCRRVAMLYLILFLTRLIFVAYNHSLMGEWNVGEMWALMCGALKFDTTSILYANGLFILLSLLPFHFREKNWYREGLYWLYMVINFVLVIVPNIADIIYFRYTQKRFTADEIFFADNDNSLMLMGKFAAENWYLVLAGIVLVWILGKGYGRHHEMKSIFQRGWAYNISQVGILVIVAGLSVAGIRGGFTRMTRPITLSNATFYTTNPSKANLILSNPFCILRTAGGSDKISYKKYFSKDEIEQYFTPTHEAPTERKYHLAGRNVVVFIMESMSAEHSYHLCPEVYENVEEKGFTPFLDSLMQEGMTFRKMYANGYRSIQAMPSVLGSMPSLKTPFVLMAQSLGKSQQLPQILKEEGYTTAFFCGSAAGSMGFGAYARSAGVDILKSREDYEQAHGTEDFDGAWGIWDEKFLQYAGEEFSEMKEPFFSSLFTISSHHPFAVPEEYRATLPAGYTKIHKGVAYDDMAFRRFFHRFQNEEWFRRTLFVFVADHVSSERFAPKTQVYPGNRHIIGFMYTPDGCLKGEVGEITQQLDLMPTILGILGYDKPYFAYGRDVFNEKTRPE